MMRSGARDSAARPAASVAGGFGFCARQVAPKLAKTSAAAERKSFVFMAREVLEDSLLVETLIPSAGATSLHSTVLGQLNATPTRRSNQAAGRYRDHPRQTLTTNCSLASDSQCYIIDNKMMV